MVKIGQWLVGGEIIPFLAIFEEGERLRVDDRRGEAFPLGQIFSDQGKLDDILRGGPGESFITVIPGEKTDENDQPMNRMKRFPCPNSSQ